MTTKEKLQQVRDWMQQIDRSEMSAICAAPAEFKACRDAMKALHKLRRHLRRQKLNEEQMTLF